MRAARHEDDGRGMLKDHAKHSNAWCAGLFKQNAGRADPEVDLALLDRPHGVDVGPALADFDVETSVPIKPLLQRGVIPGELELVQPLELQRDLVQSPARGCEQDSEGG